jgi:hypothetical protein
MQPTIYYPTETEFQAFLSETTEQETLICAEYSEQVQEDVPAGDNLEHELAKLGLHLQTI